MSNLVEHARKELALLGEEPETIEGYLKVVQAFADMGHSGGSASVALAVIPRLLSYQHLTPITANPDDWMLVAHDKTGGTDVWQCKRNGALFSDDGGITYHNVNAPSQILRSEPYQQALDI